MNGIKYVADTNCFIYLLEANSLLIPFADEVWAFSYITEIELLSKKDLSKQQDAVIRDMLSTCYKVNQSQAISDLTIDLKRKYNIKIPDAIIAATSILLKIPLITADKGFMKIKEIDCVILEI